MPPDLRPKTRRKAPLIKSLLSGTLLSAIVFAPSLARAQLQLPVENLTNSALTLWAREGSGDNWLPPLFLQPNVTKNLYVKVAATYYLVVREETGKRDVHLGSYEISSLLARYTDLRLKLSKLYAGGGPDYVGPEITLFSASFYSQTSGWIKIPPGPVESTTSPPPGSSAFNDLRPQALTCRHCGFHPSVVGQCGCEVTHERRRLRRPRRVLILCSKSLWLSSSRERGNSGLTRTGKDW
jgi:hypothetical protein